MGLAPPRWALFMPQGANPATGAPTGGVPTASLLPGERVLAHWAAPAGQGVVTTLRVMLFGHPKPIHRELEWAEPLDQIQTVEVEREDVSSLRPDDWGSSGWHAAAGPALRVMVDNVSVFLGYPKPAAEVQGWIEEARAARMQQLGREPLRSEPGGSDSDR